MEEMKTSENIMEITKALAKAQGEFDIPLKTKKNYFEKKYADLADIWQACRKQLSENGLSVIQPPETSDEGELKIETTLFHESGQYISSTLKVKGIKQGLPEMGSAITYAKRYALSGLLGLVADEDDDGQEATTDNKAKQQPQRPQPPQKPNGNGGGGLKHGTITKEQLEDLRNFNNDLKLSKESLLLICNRELGLKTPDGNPIQGSIELSKEQAETVLEKLNKMAMEANKKEAA